MSLDAAGGVTLYVVLPTFTMRLVTGRGVVPSGCFSENFTMACWFSNEAWAVAVTVRVEASTDATVIVATA